MIICYTVPEIWHVTDVILFFILDYFLLFYTPNNKKDQNIKKGKKSLEISSFYTLHMCTKALDHWKRHFWEKNYIEILTKKY